MSNAKQFEVLKWGAVGVGLFALAKAFGVVTPPPPPPLVDDETVEPLPAPTWTRERARVAADAIYAAIYGSGGFWTGASVEDEGAVIAILLEVGNAADCALLVDEYGVRGSSWSLSGDLNLPGALTTYLSTGDLSEVNRVYRERNIEWAW